jgi:hypothetical protein
MTYELLDEEAAANFCGLRLAYFKNLRRTGRGPTFQRPSPRMTVYCSRDLETWKASWATVESVSANNSTRQDRDLQDG